MHEIKNPFELLGFHLEEVQLKRTGNELPKDVEMKIETVDNFNDINIINLTMIIKINYEQSGMSKILYRAVFHVREDFLPGETVKYDLENLNSDQLSLLSSLIAFVFPYFRQNLTSLTNDSGFTINLPLIDVRGLFRGIKLNYAADLSDEE